MKKRFLLEKNKFLGLSHTFDSVFYYCTKSLNKKMNQNQSEILNPFIRFGSYIILLQKKSIVSETFQICHLLKVDIYNYVNINFILVQSDITLDFSNCWFEHLGQGYIYKDTYKTQTQRQINCTVVQTWSGMCQCSNWSRVKMWLPSLVIQSNTWITGQWQEQSVLTLDTGQHNVGMATR